MDDIQKALAAAWNRIAPILAHNPAELQRRLARRKNKLISSPPRAWCLAVRATDRRLDRYTMSSFHPSSLSLHPSHQLLLDSDALAHLCGPIHIPAPGLTVNQLARLLGVSRGGLLHARVAGLFGHHHLNNPRRKSGREPLLYTKEPLDPASRLFAQTDPVWSITARHAPLRIRDHIEATLTRIPIYYDPNTRYRDKSDLHPEHPAHNDWVAPCRKKSLALPPASKDYISYKWKGDEYIGYDWRAAQRNPHIKQNYERHQARLAKARAASNRRRQENPAPSRAADSLKFRGYRWRCPQCDRLVNLLFLPLPRLHLLPLPCRERVGVRVEPPERHTPSDAPHQLEIALARFDARSKHHAPQQKFACEKCHHIKRQSRCDKNAWNELVTYLSAGLLFGREVEPPPWWPRPQSASDSLPGECAPGSPIPTRKIAYTPRPNRAPSSRRPQIETLLLAGQSFEQIAQSLGLAKGTILWHAQQVYKQHNVRTLIELLRKHHKPLPGQTHQTPEIRRRLLAGESVGKIAADLGVNRTMIYNQRQWMKKRGEKLQDAQQFNRTGGSQRRERNATSNVPS